MAPSNIAITRSSCFMASFHLTNMVPILFLFYLTFYFYKVADLQDVPDGCLPTPKANLLFRQFFFRKLHEKNKVRPRDGRMLLAPP